MKRLVLILLFLATVPLNVHAFKSAGLGFGPNFKVKGSVETSFMAEGNWNPHRNVGARFFVGFLNGFWTGVALNTTFSLYETKDLGFDYSVNFSLPFMINIHNGAKAAFIGFTAGNTLSFAIDKSNRYYIFVSPAEFVFIPLTWSWNPGSGFDTGLEMSLRCAFGVKVRI